MPFLNLYCFQYSSAIESCSSAICHRSTNARSDCNKLVAASRATEYSPTAVMLRIQLRQCAAMAFCWTASPTPNSASNAGPILGTPSRGSGFRSLLELAETWAASLQRVGSFCFVYVTWDG